MTTIWIWKQQLLLLTRQDNFSRDKYEEDNARLNHAVDEARKQLWFITENIEVYYTVN